MLDCAFEAFPNGEVLVFEAFPKCEDEKGDCCCPSDECCPKGDENGPVFTANGDWEGFEALKGDGLVSSVISTFVFSEGMFWLKPGLGLLKSDSFENWVENGEEDADALFEEGTCNDDPKTEAPLRSSSFFSIPSPSDPSPNVLWPKNPEFEDANGLDEASFELDA